MQQHHRLTAGLLAAHIVIGGWLTPVTAQGAITEASAQPAGAAGGTSSPTGMAADAPIDIAADEQRFDQDNGLVYFLGNVQVNYKDIQINGPEATFDMNATRQIATFVNRPRMTHTVPQKGTDTVDSDVLTINLVQDAMKAEGNTYSEVLTVAANPFKIRANTQIFDNRSHTVQAEGDVVVDHDDYTAKSPHALLLVNKEGKADRVIFSGGAEIEQEKGTVNGSKITIMVESGNLIAERDVVTNMDVEQEDAEPTKFVMKSEFQQFDKEADTVLSSGNVRIDYGNYIAKGPKANIYMKDGQVDNVLLTGRSTIIDDAREITADKIVITIDPQHFDAYGNVKTKFKQQQPAAGQAASAPAQKKGSESSQDSPMEPGLMDKQPTEHLEGAF